MDVKTHWEKNLQYPGARSGELVPSSLGNFAGPYKTRCN